MSDSSDFSGYSVPELGKLEHAAANVRRRELRWI